MRDEQINELLCNIQIIRNKATKAINFLLDKENLDFEQIKEVYAQLEVICGKTITSQVFIEMNLTDGCPSCGEEKILINWDEAIVECQNSKCRGHWSVKPQYSSVKEDPKNIVIPNNFHMIQ